MNLEEKAREFATKAHEGQLRKDGKTPYINHCASVVTLLKSEGIIDEDIICAGWLHDVIEDCGITKEQIEQEFNSNIARIVAQLTRDVDRESYKKRMRNSDYNIQIVKLADMVHNCSELNEKMSYRTVTRKVEDSDKLYLELAKWICPEFYEKLKKYLKPFKRKV